MIANGDDATSSEEDTEEQARGVDGLHPGDAPAAPSCCDRDATCPGLLSSRVNGHVNCSVNGSNSYHSDEDEDEDEDGDEREPVHCASGAGDSSVPTIYFSHTVEPKRVCMLLALLIWRVV